MKKKTNTWGEELETDDNNDAETFTMETNSHNNAAA